MFLSNWRVKSERGRFYDWAWNWKQNICILVSFYSTLPVLFCFVLCFVFFFLPRWFWIRFQVNSVKIWPLIIKTVPSKSSLSKGTLSYVIWYFFLPNWQLFTVFANTPFSPKSPLSNGTLCHLIFKLFTVLYFSVRSSRSSALRFGLHLAWVSKLLRGQGAVWEEARKIEGL